MAMESSEAKPKALDYYQAIITRLAGNSSSVKGWAISIATAVIGFGIKDGPRELAFLALLPMLLLWFLDAYYLAAERTYRGEFNRIAQSNNPVIGEIQGHLVGAREWIGAALTPFTCGVYLVMIITSVIVGSGLALLRH